MKRKKSLLLALTPGDPDGIGPEIVWKLIASNAVKKIEKKLNTRVNLLCVGARSGFEKLGVPIVPFIASATRSMPTRNKPFVWLWEAPQTPPKGLLLPGFQSGWAIQKATTFVLAKKADALVTGPISKERLQKGGFPYPGHTEFLAALCHCKEATMMMANSQLRVSLATTHLALKDVSKNLTQKTLRRAIMHTVDSLHHQWGIEKPRIAVASLNPHAGESGRFGNEEQTVITPLILKLRKSLKNTAEITGPLPADTCFALHVLAHQQGLNKKEAKANQASKFYDAIVCMYHDQGLIPAKLLDFHNTVNVTLGLPMIRTSVDHGVGFDIAGKGIANPSSLLAALELAAELASKKT